MQELKTGGYATKEPSLALLKRNAFLTMDVILDVVDSKALTDAFMDCLFDWCVKEDLFREEDSARETEETKTNGEIPDALRAYLFEIGQYPLLTSEEEHCLGKKVKEGKDAEKQWNKDSELLGTLKQEIRKEKAKYRRNYPEHPEISFSDIEGCFPASLNEDYACVWLIEEGEEARDILVNSNLRLVVSVAKKYVKQGMSMMDLIQEGNLGLIHATEKYDYTMPNRFSTYATWWIKQAIRRASISQAKNIRIPIHTAELMARVKKIEKELSQSLGRNPTTGEIAAHMPGVSEEKIKDLKRLDLQEVSLENLVGEDEKTSFLEMLEDTNAVDPKEYGEKKELYDSIHALMDTLSEEERLVLRLRYGFEDGEEKSYEAIGRLLHKDGSAVRLIEEKAMNRLLSSEKIREKELYEY